MAKAPSLEAQITEITRQFVARLLAAVRAASFSEIAGYTAAAPRGARGAKGRGKAAPAAPPPPTAGPKRRGRKPRQTVEKRAELAERILGALGDAGGPLGVRALASQVGTAADLLATPLRELRQAGKIKKHGEKRNTTYSAS